jgi:mRNA interferase MazF
MIVKRGEIWLAELNPIRGSEQAGTRPVLILQNNSINRFTKTFLAVPLTTNPTSFIAQLCPRAARRRRID